MSRRMRNGVRFASAIAAAAFLAMIAILAAEQNGPPPHEDVVLQGEIPATFYMPGSENRPGPNDPFHYLFPIPPERRPPGVLLIHGFTGDRVGLSTLARRLARNGYGVLAIDLRGHGANRNPFSRDLLREDVAQAIDYLRKSAMVNPNRIAIVGHSMGAGAALDYASRDAGIAASVMISGGFRLDGPERPRNVMFIYAQNDLPFFPQLAAMMASHVAGVESITPGEPYGDFAAGTAVEALEIPNVNHVSIIRSERAARAILTWFDSACEVTRNSSPDLSDSRLATARVVFVLMVALMFPLGWISGEFGALRDRPAPFRITKFAPLIVLAALVAAMPPAAISAPATFLSLVVGDSLISWIAIAGGLMLVAAAWMGFGGDARALGAGAIRSATAGVAAFGAVYAMTAHNVTLHRMTLTPERLAVMLAAAFLILPFFLAFEVMLRRGSTVASTILAAAGFAALLAATSAGLAIGALPFGISTQALAVTIAMILLFGAGAYHASRDLVLIATVESLWLALFVARTMPITFRF